MEHNIGTSETNHNLDAKFNMGELGEANNNGDMEFNVVELG